MNSLLLTIAGLIIAVFVAAFAVPQFIDWNKYKDVVEYHASSFVGHKVEVEGDISLRLLPVPYASLKKVRIVNEDAGMGGQDVLAELDTFTLWLSAPPLLRGQIEARQVELGKPVVYIRFDEKGSGNWRLKKNASPKMNDVSFEEETSKQIAGQNSFLDAKNISLENLSIDGGKIVFTANDPATGQNKTLFATPITNGNLVAKSLYGPFKYNGELILNGAARKIGISSGTVDKDNGVQVKAIVRNGARQKVFVDGYIENFLEDMKYKGIWKATLPVSDIVNQPLAQERLSRKERLEPVEVKAAFSGDATGIDFTKTSLTFVRQNRPQLLEANGRIEWKNAILHAKADLISQLFDVDVLAGSGALKGKVSHVLSDGAGLFTRYLAGFDQASITTAFEQMSLGGELMRNLNLKLEKQGEEIRITDLRAMLPGQNKLEFSGRINNQKSQLISGPLSVMGQNLVPLLAWLNGENDVKLIPDRPYILDADLETSERKVALKNIEADFSGAQLQGDVQFDMLSSGKKANIDLRLGSFNPGYHLKENASLRDVMLALFPATKKKSDLSAPSDDMYHWLLGHKVANVRLRIERLQLKDTHLSDFDLDVAMIANVLNVKNIAFHTKEHLEFALQGRINPVAESQDRQLSIDLVSHQPEAVGQAFALFFPDLNELDGFLLHDNLFPIRTTLDFSHHKNDGDKSILLLNGMSGDSTLEGRAEFMKEDALNVLVNPQTILHTQNSGELRFKTNNGTHLLQQLLNVKPEQAKKFDLPEKLKGSASLSWQGVLSKGMALKIHSDIGHVHLVTEGQLTRGVNRPLRFDGKSNLRAPNPNILAGYLGVDAQFNRTAPAFEFASDVQLNGEQVLFEGIKGVLGGQKVSGRLKLLKEGDVRKLSGEIASSYLDLPLLLSGLGDQSGEAGLAPQLVANDNEAPTAYWSARRFDLAFLDKVQTDLRLVAETARLAQAVEVASTQMRLTSEGRNVHISELVSALKQGELRLDLLLKGGVTTTDVEGKIQIVNVAPGDFIVGENGEALVQGKVSGHFDFKGQGLSPKGIVTLLSGDGELQTDGGAFLKISPDVLRSIADEEIKRKEELESSFNERLAGHAFKDEFKVPAHRIKLYVQDGIAHMSNLVFEDRDTKLDVSAQLALSDMHMDSRWKFSHLPASNHPELPPLTMVVNNVLGGEGEPKIRFQSKSLQRFLSVLRIETDVKRLEELNKALPVISNEPERGASVVNNDASLARVKAAVPEQHQASGDQVGGWKNKVDPARVNHKARENKTAHPIAQQVEKKVANDNKSAAQKQLEKQVEADEKLAKERKKPSSNNVFWNFFAQ